MSRRRSLAVAGLLLGAALAAGCGVGPGAGVGQVSLSVTRDFGAEAVQAPLREEAVESDTVMRVLDRNAEISTRYGGDFVSSIDGFAEATRGGSRFDWFFYVNGVESQVGAADFPLRGGEAIWWDYHDWSAALHIPAVVGSWPEPLVHGFEGRRSPVALECRGAGAACGAVRDQLRRAGVKLSTAVPDGAIRVLVGPWARLRGDPAAAQLEAGPQLSGVFARFAPAAGGFELRGLDEGGAPVRRFGPAAGLVAATRRYEAPPVWLVTGTSARGVRAAAGLLDSADLRDHYAVATEGGGSIPLPLSR